MSTTNQKSCAAIKQGTRVPHEKWGVQEDYDMDSNMAIQKMCPEEPGGY